MKMTNTWRQITTTVIKPDIQRLIKQTRYQTQQANAVRGCTFLKTYGKGKTAVREFKTLWKKNRVRRSNDSRNILSTYN
jgi:hypothetical protein